MLFASWFQVEVWDWDQTWFWFSFWFWFIILVLVHCSGSLFCFWFIVLGHCSVSGSVVWSWFIVLVLDHCSGPGLLFWHLKVWLTLGRRLRSGIGIAPQGTTSWALSALASPSLSNNRWDEEKVTLAKTKTESKGGGLVQADDPGGGWAVLKSASYLSFLPIRLSYDWYASYQQRDSYAV